MKIGIIGCGDSRQMIRALSIALAGVEHKITVIDGVDDVNPENTDIFVCGADSIKYKVQHSAARIPHSY